jgi:hypothetical protein
MYMTVFVRYNSFLQYFCRFKHTAVRIYVLASHSVHFRFSLCVVISVLWRFIVLCIMDNLPNNVSFIILHYWPFFSLYREHLNDMNFCVVDSDESPFSATGQANL